MHTLLACRSDFSIGESILTPDEIVEAATALGQTVVGLTDTMSVTGLVSLSQAAKKAGIKPIIGVRLRISEDAKWRPNKDLKEKKKDMPKSFFATVYIRSEAGLKAVYRLLTLANSETHFYYHAMLDWPDVQSELMALQSSDYALVLGDEQGIYQHAAFDDIRADCITLMNHYGHAIYLPIVAVNTPYYGRINKLSIETHRSYGLPLLAIRPAYYDAGHADAQEVMAAVCENAKASDGYFRSRFNRDMHPMNAQDFVAEAMKAAQHLIKRGVPDAGSMMSKAVLTTMGFADGVTYLWAKQPPSLPKLADDEYAALVAECQKGFLDRFKAPMFGHTPSAQEQMQTYLPRLQYELGVLKKLGFAPYFLTVQNIVRFSKSNGILVGPGRGSVGGSLVAYLMGITDIDPIRFGLLFERFINPERLDLPDADLDFMSERRGEIIEYLIQTFGEDRVAGVSNFSTLGSASAIRDVSRVLGIPEREFSVSKMVPKEHGQPVGLEEAARQVAGIKEFADKNAALWPLMLRLEGTTRNMAQHAAGVVVAGAPLTDFAVVEKRKETAVVNWDKRVIEEQGLVKIDVLGLSTLDIIAHALRYIEEGTGRKVAINEIPLDDPLVLQKFAQGDTSGVFQFEGSGMRKLLRDLGSMTGSVSFEDITACTALYRPGPMESGMMDSFAKRKRGDEAVEYLHPSTVPYTEETFGILVYQEQVMKLSQTVAGYSGPDADKLRKIMGKKLPEEMAKEHDKFVAGCVATVGCTEEWAGELFGLISGWAGYGFNKSHAAAYSLISYQSMWLKTHYPLEFYAATMTVVSEEKLLGLMRDAKSQGVVVSYPDINKSSGRFEIVRGANEIVVPFQRIKGISIKTVDAILKARAQSPFYSMADFVARVEKRACNIKAQTALDRVGAFASVEPGQPSQNDPCRVRDQVELMPSLVSDYVPINREMHRDGATKDAIIDLSDEYRAALGPASGRDGLPCKPHFGRGAKVMVITDAPSAEEEGNGMFGYARANTGVLDAMQDADLSMQEVYWTGLLKRPKRGGRIAAEEIGQHKPYLMREIEALKPTVIVALGSSIVREFLPTLKGKVSDFAGDVLYLKDLDANLVIGFSGGEIYHAPEKQEAMNKVFHVVKELMP
ncbi:DNA polymerase III subunit alpha [Paracoccus litorisediminis]|uniref:DNA polymerase III subunit alpha n=1 Tax=Paracoccus litorisediminis TaxID=2006130 RepID=A0A844HRN7_9RHOB|nr:DNA polymerase III subunit alpha [Paracoccus litorisediminis]MTH61094.1 DNA polymerase III subunit alpha [Paracoccus litorisediminis]